jgi:hypothetical protein
MSEVFQFLEGVVFVLLFFWPIGKPKFTIGLLRIFVRQQLDVHHSFCIFSLFIEFLVG